MQLATSTAVYVGSDTPAAAVTSAPAAGPGRQAHLIAVEVDGARQSTSPAGVASRSMRMSCAAIGMLPGGSSWQSKARPCATRMPDTGGSAGAERAAAQCWGARVRSAGRGGARAPSRSLARPHTTHASAAGTHHHQGSRHGAAVGGRPARQPRQERVCRERERLGRGGGAATVSRSDETVQGARAAATPPPDRRLCSEAPAPRRAHAP